MENWKRPHKHKITVAKSWLLRLIQMLYLDNIPKYWWVKKSVIYSNRGNWVNLRYRFGISGLALVEIY
jgi:hypothetical protein